MLPSASLEDGTLARCSAAPLPRHRFPACGVTVGSGTLSHPHPCDATTLVCMAQGSWGGGKVEWHLVGEGWVAEATVEDRPDFDRPAAAALATPRCGGGACSGGRAGCGGPLRAAVVAVVAAVAAAARSRWMSSAFLPVWGKSSASSLPARGQPSASNLPARGQPSASNLPARGQPSASKLPPSVSSLLLPVVRPASQPSAPSLHVWGKPATSMLPVLAC